MVRQDKWYWFTKYHCHRIRQDNNSTRWNFVNLTRTHCFGMHDIPAININMYESANWRGKFFENFQFLSNRGRSSIKYRTVAQTKEKYVILKMKEKSKNNSRTGVPRFCSNHNYSHHEHLCIAQENKSWKLRIKKKKDWYNNFYAWNVLGMIQRACS